MSSLGPCRIAHLPFDIWEAGLLPRLMRRDLTRISLTCRCLRTLLSPYVFSEIRLSVPHFGLDLSMEPQPRRKDLLATFIRRLQSAVTSDILAHTRILHLGPKGIPMKDFETSDRYGPGFQNSQEWKGHRQWQDIAIEHASTVFPLLLHLRDLTLHHMRITATHLDAISALDGLQSLSITGCIFDFHPHMLDSLNLRLHALTVGTEQRSPCVERLVSSLVHSRIQNVSLRLGDNLQAYDALECRAPLNKVRAAELSVDGLSVPLTTLSRFFPNAESFIINTLPATSPEVFGLVPGSLAYLRRLVYPCDQLKGYFLDDMHLEDLSIHWVQDADIDLLRSLWTPQTFALSSLTSLSIRLQSADDEKAAKLLNVIYVGSPVLYRLTLWGNVENPVLFLDQLALSQSIRLCWLEIGTAAMKVQPSSTTLKNATLDMLRRMSDYPGLEYLVIWFPTNGLRVVFDRDVYGPLSADTYLQQCSVVEEA